MSDLLKPVLLVRGADDTNITLRSLLRGTPYEIEVVDSVTAALERARHGNYCSVFVDVPDVDADCLAAVRRIRDWEPQERSKRLPIIALVASGSARDVGRMLEAGCCSYLVKPFGRQELFHALDRCENTPQ